MKIALVEPPHRYLTPRIPIGLLLISANLDKHNYSHMYIDSRMLSDKEIKSVVHVNDILDKMTSRIIEEVRSAQINILCFTCMLNEEEWVIEISSKIKQIMPGVKIVVGGPYPTIVPDVFYEHKVIDFLVVGEGEDTIIDLFDHLKDHLNVNDEELLDKIKGIIFKNNQNEYISNLRRDYIKDISSLPFPNYKKVDSRRIYCLSLSSIRWIPVRSMQIISSRGCPFNCSFCSGNKILGLKIRFRSFQSIEEEIIYLKEEFGIEAIYFVDDTIFNDAHLEIISKVMTKHKLFWGIQSNVHKVNEKKIALLKKTGCIQIDFGVESGSNRILRDVIGKHFSPKEVIKAFKLCRKFKIRTYANFMYGFPGESYKEVMQTILLALYLRPDAYGFWTLVPLPGTRLWNKYKHLIDSDINKKVNFSSPVVSFNKRNNRANARLKAFFYFCMDFLYLLRIPRFYFFVFKNLKTQRKDRFLAINKLSISIIRRMFSSVKVLLIK